jgi:DNA processing protein
MAADDARQVASRPPAVPVTAACSGDGESRARCAWLGGLSSYRQGVVGRLVREYGTVAAAIDRPAGELAALLSAQGRRPRGPAPATPGTRDGRPALQRSAAASPPEAPAAFDAAAFQALVSEDPSAYLRRLETRPSGHSVVTWCDSLYPSMLRHLPDPPLCLFIRHRCGSRDLGVWLAALGTVPVVAVVGARVPSLYGEEMAALLGRDLTRRGAVVVSGLATGIDAAAQRAAVAAAPRVGRPVTVAVLGCGADVIYPRVNAALQTDIVSLGLVVSEFAWGVPARAWRFPARNRIMAALAHAVVMVEGTERSGARITVDFALDLGREVLAVPGEAGRRVSAAPHALLRQGAGLCESASDVLDAIAPPGSHFSPIPAAGSADGPDRGSRASIETGAAAVVLRLLEDGPLTVDQIARRSAIPASVVAAALSELEVDGLLRGTDGGAYRLRRR